MTDVPRETFSIEIGKWVWSHDEESFYGPFFDTQDDAREAAEEDILANGFCDPGESAFYWTAQARKPRIDQFLPSANTIGTAMAETIAPTTASVPASPIVRVMNLRFIEYILSSCEKAHRPRPRGTPPRCVQRLAGVL